MTARPSTPTSGSTTQALYPQLAERLGIDADDRRADRRGDPRRARRRRRAEGAGDEPISFQGPGDRAGGDVIIAVDGEELVRGRPPAVRSRAAIRATEVTLEIIRDGEHEDVDVTLGTRPDA